MRVTRGNRPRYSHGMLPSVRCAVFAGGLFMTSGCALDLSGREVDLGDAGPATTDESPPPEADAAGPDGGLRPPRDAGPPRDASTFDATAADATSPNGCANAATPCAVVPPGWTLVALAAAQSSPCPTGFDSAPASDVVEGPSVAGGCSCGACSVTAQPSCASGAIAVTYDTNTTVYAGTCNTTATPSPLGNAPPGSCGTDIYQGDYSTFDVRYAAPGPTGGTCTSPGVQNSAALSYAARDRLCAPNDAQAANCSGGMCRPSLGGPYEACIAAPGEVPCPPGPLAVAHHVGTSASYTCADCACTVTAKCSGTLTLYTDTSCTKAPYAISTDVCVGISSAATYKAYKYTAAAPQTVGCQAGTPDPAPTVALTGEQTVCCAR